MLLLLLLLGDTEDADDGVGDWESYDSNDRLKEINDIFVIELSYFVFF